jgi:tetratricopeptide (TPR) repeat protein
VLAGVLVVASACGSSVDPDEALQEGLAQQRAGNVSAAADSYQRVLDVRPGDKYANYNLGVIEQGNGRTALAEGYYRAALDTDPAFAPALFNLAIVRTGVGATQEARDLYVRVIAERPDYAAAHFNLGLLYEQAGRSRESQTEFDRALELDPTLADRLTTQPIEPEGTDPGVDGGARGSESPDPSASP